MGRRRTGTRHGNVYRSVIEKQGIVAGIVVYRQGVLQTVTILGVVSLVFRRHVLLKIANFNSVKILVIIVIKINKKLP